MSSFSDYIKNSFQQGGMFLKLVYINVGVFFATSVLDVFLRLFLINSSSIQWLSLNSGLFSNWYKPWAIVTYMFIHVGFAHLFFNMLILFFVGDMFERYIGSKQLLKTYLIGGLAGGILFILTQNIFPLFANGFPSTLLGASAAVMAVFVGLAAYHPNLEVALFGIFNVRLSVLALIYVGMDILSLSSLDGVAHFAHLGGALWGGYYGYNLRKGKDVSRWFDTFLSLFKRKSKLHVSYREKKKHSSYQKPPRNDYDYNAEKQNRQKKLDAILDKIKVGGYETLTQEEKDFLARY